MSEKGGKAAASIISLASTRDKPDYYEILQLEPDANHADIVRAHRHAMEIYKQNSLAAYSLFNDKEKGKALAQIDEAYHVLAFPDKRALYDQAYMRRWPEKTAAGSAGKPNETKKNPARVAPQKDKREFEQLVTETRVFTGATLKAIREHLQITVDEIAGKTKICEATLLAIEDEETALLPSGVYLKSFVRQYAAQLGLDPQKVVDSYPPLQDVE